MNAVYDPDGNRYHIFLEKLEGKEEFPYLILWEDSNIMGHKIMGFNNNPETITSEIDYISDSEYNSCCNNYKEIDFTELSKSWDEFLFGDDYKAKVLLLNLELSGEFDTADQAKARYKIFNDRISMDGIFKKYDQTLAQLTLDFYHCDKKDIKARNYIANTIIKHYKLCGVSKKRLSEITFLIDDLKLIVKDYEGACSKLQKYKIK